MKALGPILAVVAAIIALWYAAAVPMNIQEVLTQAERAGAVVEPEGAMNRRDVSRFALVLKNADHLADGQTPSPADEGEQPKPHGRLRVRQSNGVTAEGEREANGKEK
mgnify:CR=1 FL=1